MITLRKKLRVLAVTAGAIGVLVAVAASPAMASEVGTKFNAGTIKLTGSGLTLKKNGAEAKTCEIKSPSVGTTSESEGYATAYNDSIFLQTNFVCTGGTTFSLPTVALLGRYETTTGLYSLRFEASGTGDVSKSPWGSYYSGYYGMIVGGWTNGSGATASTINFNEYNVGVLASDVSKKLTLTGAIAATTKTGGLLTLSH